MKELTASIGSSVASASSFEDLEDGVFAAICEHGRGEMAAALRARDDELHAGAPAGWRLKDRRGRTVLTRFGPVKVYRRRYVDERGAARYLLDESLGLARRARVSPSLEHSMQHSRSKGVCRLARQGRRRRLDLEVEYWRLILSGIGTFHS